MDYLLVSLKTLASYIYLLLLMKIMGKREIGELSLFDLIILLSIADIMVVGIGDYKENILFAFIPMLIVTLLQKIIAFWSLKNHKLRKLVDGSPSYIIMDGKLNIDEMRKQKYNVSDLYTQLHLTGVKGVAEVEHAILESSGKLAVFKNNKNNTCSFPIIVSGEVDDNALKLAGKSNDWLNETLKAKKMDVKKVLAAEVVNGKLYIVERVEKKKSS